MVSMASPANNARASSSSLYCESQCQTSGNKGKSDNCLARLSWALTRKKPLDKTIDTKLERCLGFFDLTTIGVGSTLGLGLYVLAGNVASTKAGPAVIISFAFAAIASAFSALCYAEFSGLVPKAGSAYVYSYITVGEFAAFFIGWNLILEYAIGGAAVTRGFSDHLKTLMKHITKSSDALCNTYNNYYDCSNNINININVNSTNNTTIDNFNNSLPEFIEASNENLSSFQQNHQQQQHHQNHSLINFDPVPFIIVALITIPLALGVKCSTKATIIFTSINMFVVLCVIISGLFVIDGFQNWHIPQDDLRPNLGKGGFMPFGWAGVFAGASTCFFGFTGFDTIASSAEEARNPQRNVPLSIIISLFISSLAYMSIAIVQTLLWPYHDQARDAILPYVFQQLNMPLTYWIVTIGGLAGLTSSQLGAMIPLPRTLYSMASDKLVYSFLDHINQRFKIPLRAVIVGSLLVAPLAATVETDTLADMVSIGTLAAYSIVSLSVLILRYEYHNDIKSTKQVLDQSESLNFAQIFGIQDAGSQENSTGTEMKKVSLSKPTPDDENASYQNQTTVNVDIKSIIQNKPSMTNVDNSCCNIKTTTHQSTQANDIVNIKSQRGVSTKQTWHSLYELLTMTTSDDRRFELGPTRETSKLSKIIITIIVIQSLCFDLIAYLWINSDQDTILDQADMALVVDTNMIAGVCIIVVLLLTSMLLLTRLPVNKRSDDKTFRVPLVPLIPILSIIVNVYLMMSLNYKVWIRFTVWMAFGFFIYFTYGIKNSIGYLTSNFGGH